MFHSICMCIQNGLGGGFRAPVSLHIYSLYERYSCCQYFETLVGV
jgi:hypothetical protein